MIGLPISSASVVPMPEVNSSPRKLTAPQGLYETVSKFRFADKASDRREDDAMDGIAYGIIHACVPEFVRV
ncbi:hypothetical protein A8F38_07415 [Burkholderia cenocepacia]|nr:hypothetical protein A8F38_07415 [Burkholderia cenocepacia]